MKLKLSKSTIAFLIILVVIAGMIIGIRLQRHYKEQKYLEENFLTYNGFKFQRMAELWWTDWVRGQDQYSIPFRFSPVEAESVPILGNVANYSMDELYITFNPGDEELQYVALAASELTISLAKVFSIQPQSACTNESEGVCPPRPVVTCGNTNASVILLQVANETQIQFEENCITFEGKGFELVRAVDKFLYMLYGIM